MAASWVDLHQDLLDLVVANLLDPGDRARARAVCRSWHAAVRRHGPQAAQLPWIVFPDGEFITPTNGSRWECPGSIPDNARCRGSADEWLLLGIYEQNLIYIPEDEVESYCFNNYVLHNIFPLEYVPLTELDAVLHRAYHVLKFRMRSTARDFIAVTTTNENHPLIVILPGKGVWLPEPRAEPYIYIVDIAFSGDKLYGITKAGDLIPFDLGLDEDGRPMVTIGRRVIRQPLDYMDYDWWPPSDSDDDDRDIDDDDDYDDVVGEEEGDVAIDEDNEEEEKMEATMDVKTAGDNGVVDFDQDWTTMANDNDDGEKDHNYLNSTYYNGNKEITSWHLVQSWGELFMVKTRTSMLPDYTMSTRQVDVFMADVNTCKWVPMANGLGGSQTLFISPDYSKFVYAPCGDVEEDAIYLLESGEVFNTKTHNASPTRFRERCYFGEDGMWLFPPELVL
ncbi:hypothetical protein CFC21_069906 [Triticum aestivum]|uniref:KIB1-4 beta-propeller domain-containing protein n=2 Tax=Triticum aestivum TaxID=4565 RepID=A0A3B6LG86_WHEAT|nr:hypothetical protein CFC21_069906 [Triticum aestivum]